VAYGLVAGVFWIASYYRFRGEQRS
jgi:hypothetical protein